MRYRETFNIQGRELEYIGIYIPLYGLTDLLIDYYYTELIRAGDISVAEVSPAGRVVGSDTDKKLRCIAETAEGRKVLAGFTYWGSSVHHAARGHSRLAPDWYIDPEGPTGYIVHGKIHSKYFNEPLSKDEFYRRNVGRDIPEGPSAFQSVFHGVTGIFTKALGLQSLMNVPPPPEIIPVRDRFSTYGLDKLDIFDDEPAAPKRASKTAAVPAASTRSPSPTDYRALLATGPMGEYPSAFGYHPPPADYHPPPADYHPAAPPTAAPPTAAPPTAAPPTAAPPTAAPPEDLLPTVPKDVEIPTDPAEHGEFMERVRDHIVFGLDQIDGAGKDDLVKFAEQLGVTLPKASIAAKRDFMKAAVLEQTAQRTKSDMSALNDLYTYRTASGVDYLELAPDTVDKVTTGLDLINKKFKDVDLKAYASSKKVPGYSKLRGAELRKKVLTHYIDKLAPESLTPAEKSKYRPGKLKREYGITK